MARRSLVLLLGAMAVPVGRAPAQDLRELGRRVDTARVQWNRLAATIIAFRRDSAAKQVYPDTIVIAGGAVLIVTTHEFLPVVRAAASDADSLLRHRAGSAVALMRGVVFGVRTDSIHRAHGELVLVQRSGLWESSAQPMLVDRATLRTVLEDHAQALLLRTMPTFSLWFGAGLPVDSTSDYMWERVRVELVTSRASVAHRCYGGSLDACKVTLGLTTEPDPTTTWFDSASRRAIVHDSRQFTPRVETGRCLAGSDTDCIALIRTNHYLTVVTASPSSPGARMTLVDQALATGGAGALQRMVNGGPSPSERLSAAARVPIDTLVAQWLKNVRTRGMPSETFTPWIALIALAWIVVIVALFLQSSRWR